VLQQLFLDSRRVIGNDNDGDNSQPSVQVRRAADQTGRRAPRDAESLMVRTMARGLLSLESGSLGSGVRSHFSLLNLEPGARGLICVRVCSHFS
jgi:hypothetical protein